MKIKLLGTYPDGYETPDPNGTPSQRAAYSMLSKTDGYYSDLWDIALSIQYARDPERCDARFLNQLGEFFLAGIDPGDDERTKRIKIYTAVRRHKDRGLWESTKILIDAITGLNSSVYDQKFLISDFVFLGSLDDPPVSVPWSFFGGYIDVDPLAMLFLSSSADVGGSGVILIDLGGDETMTQETIDAVIAKIRDYAYPAYLILQIGYVKNGFYYEYYTI